MNELVTNALQVSCQFRICNIGGVDRRGAEFIGKSTLIRSQIYSKLYILVLYQAVNPDTSIKQYWSHVALQCHKCQPTINSTVQLAGIPLPQPAVVGLHVVA